MCQRPAIAQSKGNLSAHGWQVLPGDLNRGPTPTSHASIRTVTRATSLGVVMPAMTLSIPSSRRSRMPA
jgi:hypothetical protein